MRFQSQNTCEDDVKNEELTIQEEFIEFAPDAPQDESQNESDGDFEPEAEPEHDDEEVDFDQDEEDHEDMDEQEEAPSEKCQQLHIEPFAKANPYASLKRPLKTVPTSEIATSSNVPSKRGDKLHEPHDSSFDQSVDDLETGDASAGPPAKRSQGHVPKQCYVCGVIVARMRDHMKMHPNELQYKCEHCPRSYLTKTGRDRHMDGQHPEMR